ncbi:MAG: diacylglycerol/lipid kinase family protein [Nitrospiria bacterium]
MTLKTLLIINPHSGTLYKRRAIPRVISYLRDHFPALEIAFTQKSGDASTLVRNALMKKIDLVLCAGGDGTINEVANQLYGTPVLLGIIPTGTGNGLAREIGLSLNPLKAVKQIMEGQVIPVYPGTINDLRFVLVSGAGFDAFVSYETDFHHPRLKKITGLLSYIIVAMIAGWKYPFYPINAKIDGRVYRCYGLIVLKAKAKIGPLCLASSLSLHKSQLGVFVFTRKGIWSIIRFFIAFLFRFHLRLAETPFIFCSQIEAESEKAIPVQYDGEQTKSFPALWKKSEKHILLICP